MGLDVIEEKNLNEVITYALDYPSMVLTEKTLPISSNLEEFAFGLYIGYISGVFFDGFLRRNNRFLDSEETSDFHNTILKHSQEIHLKIQAHLRKK